MPTPSPSARGCASSGVPQDSRRCIIVPENDTICPSQRRLIPVMQGFARRRGASLRITPRLSSRTTITAAFLAAPDARPPEVTPGAPAPRVVAASQRATWRPAVRACSTCPRHRASNSSRRRAPRWRPRRVGTTRPHQPARIRKRDPARPQRGVSVPGRERDLPVRLPIPPAPRPVAARPAATDPACSPGEHEPKLVRRGVAQRERRRTRSPGSPWPTCDERVRRSPGTRDHTHRTSCQPTRTLDARFSGVPLRSRRGTAAYYDSSRAGEALGNRFSSPRRVDECGSPHRGGSRTPATPS